MPAAALVLLLLPSMQSPNTSPLTPGTRIRVTVRQPIDGRRTVVGPLRTFDSQLLTLTTEGSGDQVSLSRSGITMIEISRGRHSQVRRGLLAGAVLGLAVVALKDVGCGQDCESSDTSAAFVAGAIGGGALLGAGVGAFMRSESWQSLPWAVGPARSGSVPLRGPWSATAAASGRYQGRVSRSLTLGLSLTF
jgi:hypothetical protein